MMAQQRNLIWTFHAFPLLYKIIPLLSPVLAMIDKSLKASLDLRGKIGAQIDELLKNPETLERSEHETIYHHLIKRHPDKGRHEIPARNSLLSEGIGLVVAGSETVAGTATVGVFHVLWDNRIYSTLIEELEAAWPDKDVNIKFEILEKLPYLVSFYYGCRCKL
jgi:cytochrome P450